MLLVIDVGNTETVIGLYTREDTDSVPVIEQGVGAVSGPSGTRARRPA